MKKIFLQQHMMGILATLLVVPSIYFIAAAFLNYAIGINGPWQLISPIVEEPSNKQIGLNMNLLVVFGPIASLTISIFQVVKMEVKKHGERLEAVTLITTKSYHWFIIAASLLCIGSMFLYFIGENCNCH